MKLVRFSENYCASINNRMSYELVSDEIHMDYDLASDRYIQCYDLKLIGWIPCYKLEEATGDEIEAIDVFVHLSNL